MLSFHPALHSSHCSRPRLLGCSHNAPAPHPLSALPPPLKKIVYILMPHKCALYCQNPFSFPLVLLTLDMSDRALKFEWPRAPYGDIWSPWHLGPWMVSTAGLSIQRPLTCGFFLVSMLFSLAMLCFCACCQTFFLHILTLTFSFFNDKCIILITVTPISSSSRRIHQWFKSKRKQTVPLCVYIPGRAVPLHDDLLTQDPPSQDLQWLMPRGSKVLG